MALQQLDWKNYTIEVNINTYEIPGVDVDVATIVETISTRQGPQGSITKNVNIQKGPKTKNSVLNECTPVFVKDSFFESIKTCNPFYNKDGAFRNFESIEIKNSDIITTNVSFQNLIWMYFSGNMLFNSNEKPITIPHYFDYIGTPFTNEYCNLNELLSYLKSHPWVVNKEELVIKNIPYYNACENSSECISDVLIRPDQQTYEKIYDSCKGHQYFSCRMKDNICGMSYIFNRESKKDWLGIAPFLK